MDSSSLLQLAQLLLDRFAGRLDTFLIQTQTGEYVRLPYSLSFSWVLDHVRGSTTLSIYPILENKVKFICFDWDSLEKHPFSQLRYVLETHGLPQGIPEYTGGRGYHLWIPLNGFYPSKPLHYIAKFISERFLHGKLEIIPAQPVSTPEGFSHPIRLPLGRHRVTRKRSVLIPWDEFDSFSPECYLFDIEQQLQVLRSIQPSDPREWVVSGALGEYLERNLSEPEPQPVQEVELPEQKLPCISFFEKGVPESIRNLGAYVLAVYYHSKQLDQKQVMDRLKSYNIKCDPPQSYSEIRNVVDSVFRKGRSWSSRMCGYIRREIKARSSGRFTSWFCKECQLNKQQ